MQNSYKFSSQARIVELYQNFVFNTYLFFRCHLRSRVQQQTWSILCFLFIVVINYDIEQQLKFKHKSKLKYIIRRHVHTQTHIHNNKRLKPNGLHYDCLCGKKHKHKCPDYGRHLYGQYKCMLFVGIELVSIIRSSQCCSRCANVISYLPIS